MIDDPFDGTWRQHDARVLDDDTISVYDNQSGEKQDIPVAGFFLAIGHIPNTSMFKEWLDMEPSGYLIHQPNTTKTNVPGVFVSGDAADHVYRQAITAAGTGCMAALDAERYLGSIGVI